MLLSKLFKNLSRNFFYKFVVQTKKELLVWFAGDAKMGA